MYHTKVLKRLYFCKIVLTVSTHLFIVKKAFTKGVQ